MTPASLRAYYIQNQPLVAGGAVNFETDPPPDLVVEVDITHSDIDKNRLCGALGVSEFWRYNGKTWRIYQLCDGEYQECDRSPTFPWVKKEDLYTFLENAYRDEIEPETLFRAYVQTQLRPSENWLAKKSQPENIIINNIVQTIGSLVDIEVCCR